MAEQTKFLSSGRERAAHAEAAQDQRWLKEMVFIPFEGTASLSSRKEQRRQSLDRVIQTRPGEPGAEATLLDSMAGTSAVNPSVEKHADLLSDPRFLHSVNIARSARLVNRMHKTYGNTYIQRVVERIQTKWLSEPPALPMVQRDGSWETLGRWPGGEPEPQTIATAEPEEERELPGPRIERVPEEAPATEREEEEQRAVPAAAQGGGLLLNSGTGDISSTRKAPLHRSHGRGGRIGRERVSLERRHLPRKRRRKPSSKARPPSESGSELNWPRPKPSWST